MITNIMNRRGQLVPLWNLIADSLRDGFFAFLVPLGHMAAKGMDCPW
jgi:hypothetical protein